MLEQPAESEDHTALVLAEDLDRCEKEEQDDDECGDEHDEAGH